MKKSILYITFVLAALCTSCKGFLDEYSQNLTYVETVADLDEMLVGGGYILESDVNSSDYPSVNLFEFLHLMGDESRELVTRNQLNRTEGANERLYSNNRGFFSWALMPFTTAGARPVEDGHWALFYQRISCLNNILAEAQKFDSGLSDAETKTLARVKGEACFLRAWNYFMLANLYGAAYDKSNPDDGASVTLKLTPEVDFENFSRASSGVVYGQIVADLKDAIANFASGDTKDTKWRANAAAAWALLSRVYLYMEEYTLAAEAADKVTGYALFDLANNYVAGSGKAFLTTASPEQIFIQGKSGGVTRLHARNYTMYPAPPTPIAFANCFGVAEELQGLFDANDIRFSAFFTYNNVAYATPATNANVLMSRKTGSGTDLYERDPITPSKNPYTTDVGSGESFGECISIRYAEVVLNKAEALACDNQIAPATAAIRQLLDTRYVTPPAIPTAQAELIAFIRTERRKELCFEGHRWFDLRRYAVNSVAPVATTIVHEYHDPALNDAIAGKYTLAPYSETTLGSWSLPVPAEVLDYNFPNITNPDREAGVTQTIY